MVEHVLRARGPFSLAAARRFLSGFIPGSAAEGDRFHIAFCLDGSYAPVAVSIDEIADGVRLQVFGDVEASVVVRQVARILSLDHDGAAFAELGRREPVVGGLQARFPLRPVCFPSPYETAVWSVVSTRLAMRQSATLKRRIAREHGTRIVAGGCELWACPSPSQLLELRDLSGLPAQKLAALHGIARAALDGQLDPDVLRARPTGETRALLQRIPGVGPYTAEGVVVRGLGLADELPVCEPRVYRGAALAYGLLRTPDVEGLTRIAERWRPFRTWVSVLGCVLLRRSGHWAGAPGERKQFFKEVR